MGLDHLPDITVELCNMSIGGTPVGSEVGRRHVGHISIPKRSNVPKESTPVGSSVAIGNPMGPIPQDACGTEEDQDRAGRQEDDEQRDLEGGDSEKRGHREKHKRYKFLVEYLYQTDPLKYKLLSSSVASFQFLIPVHPKHPLSNVVHAANHRFCADHAQQMRHGPTRFRQSTRVVGGDYHGGSVVHCVYQEAHNSKGVEESVETLSRGGETRLPVCALLHVQPQGGSVNNPHVCGKLGHVLSRVLGDPSPSQENQCHGTHCLDGLKSVGVRQTDGREIHEGEGTECNQEGVNKMRRRHGFVRGGAYVPHSGAGLTALLRDRFLALSVKVPGSGHARGQYHTRVNDETRIAHRTVLTHTHRHNI